MSKTKKIIFTLLGFALIGIGFLLSSLGNGEVPQKYEFLYSIQEGKVDVVNGVPYFYTHLSFDEGERILYYPVIEEEYLYLDTAGYIWMAQEERIKAIRLDYYSRITSLDTFKIFKKTSPFANPNELFVENEDGLKIPLFPDPYENSKSKGTLEEMKKIMKKIDDIQNERGLEKMESDLEKASE